MAALALAAGQDPASAGAGHDVTLRNSSLGEVQAALFGAAGDGGLVGRGERFEVTFERMKLAGHEVPHLLAIIQAAITLPARSEITLEGRVDHAGFKATVEKNRKGRAKVRMTGLAFADREQVIGFVSALTQRGADECRVRALVGHQPIEVRVTRGR